MGIGADGLLIVTRDPCSMRIFNRDGSEAAMCGNGLRCFVRYCIDQGLTLDAIRRIKTKAGMMKVIAITDNPFTCTLDLGKPKINPTSLGITTHLSAFHHQKLAIDHQIVIVSSVRIGAIHTVLYDSNLTYSHINELGAKICNDSIFTQQTNVDFVNVLDEHTIELATYERGAGVTYACGTGACAAAFIAILDGKCQSPLRVVLPYGDLLVEVNDTIRLTGDAVKIAQGYWEE